MKALLKIISAFLVILMCVGILGTPVLAAPFNCEIMLKAYHTQDRVRVSVTTDQYAGAVSCNLIFDSDLLSFDPEHTIVYEEGITAADVCRVEGNTITFTAVSDDLTNGATQWIDFAFTVKGSGTATFSVSNALAADVDENLSATIAVSPTSIYVGDRISSWSLTLGDHIGANFCVYTDDIHNTQVSFTVAGKTSIINASDAKPQGEDFYVFSTNVAAAQMTDPITVQVLVNGNVVDSGSYTIRQYADYILSGSYTENEKALVRAMLNYGGKAQHYFNYNTDSLANTNITITEAEIPTDTEPPLLSGEVDGLKFYGSTLVFGSKTALRFYFL